MSKRSFIELALRGEVLSDEIDDFVEEWHSSDSDTELYEFLGMSWDEYSLWTTEPDSLNLIIQSRYESIPLREAVNDNLQASERLAARSDEAGKLTILKRWIERQSDR
ncbi:hypothetical protein [Erythrobacter sp. R86502]|uniref:hypothetical protein n=1 Tax=Erythrobacter sp. R86502 TaxID=3093846 RepID=UPI0036D242FA